jgi:hypothetical protein
MRAGGSSPECLNFSDYMASPSTETRISDEHTGLSLWLLFSSLAEVQAAVNWTGSTSAWPRNAEMLNTFSHGSAQFEIATARYAALRKRTRGWPWTGYELMQIWSAGRYPPERLSPGMERWFLKQRR